MPTSILLPLDGSERSTRAGDAALDRAETADCTVHALYVVDTARYGEPALSSAETLVDEAEDRGRDRLAEFAARGRDRGVDVETRCCHGRPAEELLAYARAVDADEVLLYRRVPHAVRDQLADVADRIHGTWRPVA
jgi:nucleotide-binding universal stress UspA family protein